MTQLQSSFRALAAAAVLLASTPALSQAPASPTSPDTVSPDTSAGIEDAKVEQFAAAFVAVQQIQAQAAQQLSGTTTEQQATEVKASAEKKMIAAVEREGLQVEEFNYIASLLTTDLALRSRVIEKVERRRKG